MVQKHLYLRFIAVLILLTTVCRWESNYNYSSLGASSIPIHIPIQINLPSGLSSLNSTPVTFGVPFPKGRLRDVNHLRLVDGFNHSIPFQSEITGYWYPDASIKWVRFDALVNPNHSLFLTDETTSDQSEAAPKLTVKQVNGKISVETGSARYILTRGISPIDEIWIGPNCVAAGKPGKGLYVTDQNGRVASASTTDETMTIESNGSIAATIRFEGNYATASGEILARHITRLEFFAGQSTANITHTLILTRNSNEIQFSDIGWELSVTPGSNPTANFGSDRNDWRQSQKYLLTQSTDAAFMIQDDHYFFAHNRNHFAISTVQNHKPRIAIEGSECGDWSALSGSKGGMLVSCTDAALQHPKEFYLERNRVTLHLFSNRNGDLLDFRAPALVKKWDLRQWYTASVPKSSQQDIELILKRVSNYDFNAAGWSKTHELLVVPLPPNATTAEMSQLAYKRSNPVYAMPDPNWIAQTEAIGSYHPRDANKFSIPEKAIEAGISKWQTNVTNWGDYGFVDYGMGPHLEYSGKYPNQIRYNNSTYTLRSDLWKLYARSGERKIREFAQTTNRSLLDACMSHWEVPGKPKGLFLQATGTDLPAGNANPGMLPFYWETAKAIHNASSSNLDAYFLDYYLTGSRRTKEVMQEYASAVLQKWNLNQVHTDERPLMLLRMLSQLYGFTGNQEFRRMANATMDILSRPDSQLGIIQPRKMFQTELENTTYKLDADVRALIDSYQILGDQRYLEAAKRVARYDWTNFFGAFPLFYCNPTGVAGDFLYNETHDLRYRQGLTIQLRYLASTYDNVKQTIEGISSVEKTTFLFEGVPLAEKNALENASDTKHHASWIGFDDMGDSTAIVIRKTGNNPINIDVWQCKDLWLSSAQNPTVHLSKWIASDGYQHSSIALPKSAATGDYLIGSKWYGQHLAIADAAIPMVVYAPGYWRPYPSQTPSVRYYFKVPVAAIKPTIVFEGSAQLITPSGTLYRNGEVLHGEIELSAGVSGLWSFCPVNNQLIRVKNIPPFFAAESPENYFEPSIAGQSNHLLDTQSRTGFSIDNRTFHFISNEKSPSNDGSMYLPGSTGTIEFWYRPNQSTSSEKANALTICSIRAANGKQIGYLRYQNAPNSTNSQADQTASHTLEGSFDTDGLSGKKPLRAWRRVLLQPNEWTHIAWVWGYRNGIIPRTPGYNRVPADSVMVMELYINGKLGQTSSYTWLKNRLIDIPTQFDLPKLEASIDELRISDTQRYTVDFQPLKHDQRLKVDTHTRALFHFDGNTNGESYYSKSPLHAEMK